MVEVTETPQAVPAPTDVETPWGETLSVALPPAPNPPPTDVLEFQPVS